MHPKLKKFKQKVHSMKILIIQYEYFKMNLGVKYLLENQPPTYLSTQQVTKLFNNVDLDLLEWSGE